MAKISMFLGFFLFVLIAMPTSSSSRMMLGVDLGLAALNAGIRTKPTTQTPKSCPPKEDCKLIPVCPPADSSCPPLVCTNGVRETCCGRCPEECCPA